ncbi:MAG: PKD domain-containing protein [Flavobacteriales bacterium]|nr:PKD domain-containing protein [Flavobacteriales bacterium]
MTTTLRSLLIGSAAFLFLPVSAQQTIQFGTGTSTNLPNGFPAPYGNILNGARHQILIRADEMQAAGMYEGTIESIGFDVFSPTGAVLQGFQLRLGTTTAGALGANWVTGLSTHWGPTDHTDAAGWNDHVLDIPFVWDGVSNVVIETCFTNGTPSQNAQFRNSPTGFQSVLHRSSDALNLCSSNFGSLVGHFNRPNIRMAWSPVPLPPSVSFSVDPSSTCDGQVSFTDLSLYGPTSWSWDFGDGTTDTTQHPTHTYLSDGTYDVTLIATNAFGSAQVTTPGAVVVNVNGPRPISACVPATSNGIAGIGIIEATYAGSTYPSGTAEAEGHVDASCRLDTVYVGTLMDVGIVTGTATTHRVRCWVDWNNSGTFSASELVLTADQVMSASDQVLVPASATLNTPLRVRMLADYDLAPLPTACGPVQNGQAEDYGLVVLPNPSPPVADFDIVPAFSCDGTVQFLDQSLNAPTSWSWDFGDGNVSSDQSPVHTYSGNGTYDVTLTVQNGNGSDMLMIAGAVTVDLGSALVPAGCEPATQGYCCGYGLLGLVFGGINSTSPDGSEGYVDRSCGSTATVEEGDLVPVNFTVGGPGLHDVRMWADLNNDGAFTANELLFEATPLNAPNALLSIPFGAVLNTPLRLRVQADVQGSSQGPCDEPAFGQTEDHAIIISPNQDPPLADFEAVPTTTCTGEVQFTDLSTQQPTSWSWDFGDGGTSTDQSPIHLYQQQGIYTVSLTVANANGQDVEVRSNYITYPEPWVCDTVLMPTVQTGGSLACFGVLTDDGGPNADHSPGAGQPFTIAPPGAEHVTLVFSEFAFETNFDELEIFDGPTIGSPPLGPFTGNGLGVLPNNGVITSSGGSITIRQNASPGPTTWSGFILEWSCSVNGIPEHANEAGLRVWPNPARGQATLLFDPPLQERALVTIQDPLGRVGFRTELPTGTRNELLDLAGLAPGAHVVVVTTPTGRRVQKLLVE